MKKFDSNILIPIAILAIVVIGIFWLLSSGSNSAVEPINKDTWSKGNLESSVELTEFSDYECPACSSAYLGIEDLVNKYSKYIKFTYRHYPLTTIHKYAFRFAEAAEAAGYQGKFFEFTDVVFRKHDEIFSSENPEEKMMEFAKAIEGLDFDKFKSDYESEKFKPDVLDDQRTAQRLGLNSTPSFLINGEVFEWNSYADIENQLVKAIQDAGYKIESEDSENKEDGNIKPEGDSKPKDEQETEKLNTAPIP